MCNETYDSFDADNYCYVDLGIDKEGEFDGNGMPCGWSINVDRIGEKIPRFLLTQPVLDLSINPDQNVYVRGLYSDHLSKKRRAAYYRNHKLMEVKG